jgi:hypothetical protein
MDRGPHFETYGLLGAQRMPALSGELERRDRARMAELTRLIRAGVGSKKSPPRGLDADDVRSIKRALRGGMSTRAVKAKFRVPLRLVEDILAGRAWSEVAA